MFYTQIGHHVATFSSLYFLPVDDFFHIGSNNTAALSHACKENVVQYKVGVVTF